MGQKVNPHGLRVGVIKDWDSKWYAEKDFADNLVEDYNIRTFLKKKLYSAGVAKIEIERASERVKVIIYTAKPGVVIGKGGSEIEKVKKEIELKLLRGEVQLKNKTITYILTLYETYGQNQIFGRTQVENVIGVKSAMASRLIKLLLDNDIIEPVSGHGKGKYRFL